MTLTNLPRIDAERLWRRQVEMDTLGATPGGGVHRLALGADDIEAHRRLAAWATARGWTVTLDDIGNMFLRRAGTDPALPPVAFERWLIEHCAEQARTMLGRLDVAPAARGAAKRSA